MHSETSALPKIVMRRVTSISAALLATVIALLLSASTLYAQKFPPLSGRMVDEAELLTPSQEEEITAKLMALENGTQRQLVVATIADLEGYEIADYGYRLGRSWGIGDNERNDGVLFIIAPNERQMRIEVGYGLEGYLTDALSSQIIRRDITPRFKAGDFAGGINAGVDSIILQLQLPPEEAAAIASSAEKVEPSPELDGGALAVTVAFVLLFGLWAGFGRHNHGRRHGRGVRTWAGGSSTRSRRSRNFGGFSGGGGSFGGGGASGGW